MSEILKNPYLYLNNIPRDLDASNINDAISDYLELLHQTDISLQVTGIMEFLNKIKREPVKKGPYPGVTIFEAANRIMTDLTILFGVRELLDQGLEGVRFEKYTVEFGNENNNAFDIEASNDRYILSGEAFNVAESYFPGKRSSALRKLKEPFSLTTDGEDKQRIILLMYNAEATKKTYLRQAGSNEYHLAVKINLPENVKPT